MNTRVSCIVPTFNGKLLLEQHLRTIIDTLGVDDELIIVDDGSEDGTSEWLLRIANLHQVGIDSNYIESERIARKADIELFKGYHLGARLTLVKLTKNMRFAKAVNTGVACSDSGYVLLLNSDAVPKRNIISNLLNHFSSDVFAIGCLEKENDQVTGGKNELWFERGLFQHKRADTFETGPTAWVSGGSGMFDREKWVALQGFDPAYTPAYWEDVDLSYRARLQNWKVLFAADAVVQHQHQTTNRNYFSQNQIASLSFKHQRYFTWLYASVGQKLQYLLWRPYWFWKMRTHD